MKLISLAQENIDQEKESSRVMVLSLSNSQMKKMTKMMILL